MSISEVEVKRLRIGTSRNGIQVEDNIYEFDKTLEADLDSLFEESEDASYPDMSGALQDMEGIEGEAGQDDDCYFGSDPLFGD